MNSPRVQAIYYEWRGTRNNHAGMAYFAKRLKKSLGIPFRALFNTPEEKQTINWVKHVARLLAPWTDCYFLMEYLSPIGVANQESVALRLKQWGIKKPVIALVHLPESLLLKYWSMEYIRSSLERVDCVVVYGSSLAKFFENIGYGHKVKRTFHYVDTDYYRPLEVQNDNSKAFKVIVVGSLLRNTSVLKAIIEQCPDVIFQICSGIQDLKPVIGGYPNVTLYGYLPEDELLNKIQQTDANLSVMEDTVGSNAILSGLACGLPQIVSEVGSIRDYCCEENSFFCKETGDYVKAIYALRQNKNLCIKMGRNARKAAEGFSLSNSIEWFRSLFITVHSKGLLNER